MVNKFNSYSNFVFPAIRGIQAGKEYYVVMCPLKLIPEIFKFNEDSLRPELRAQRTLNKSRVPEMANYMLNEDYLFSSLTASVDGDVKFLPVDKDNQRIGTLTIAFTANFLINDGQHRRAAIQKALEVKPELAHETISVVFFLDKGLNKSQQMFSDLNKYAVKPTKSLSILYDHRHEFSQITVESLIHVPIFKHYTDKERTSISNRSPKVFTLNNIYHANCELLGKTKKKPTINEGDKELIIEFWQEVYSNMVEWNAVVNKQMSAFELRKKYVHAQGLLLVAIGLLGNQIIKDKENWKIILKKFSLINWKRTNKEWNGRAIINGKISKSSTNMLLTLNYIKNKMGLSLTSKENEIENKIR